MLKNEQNCLSAYFDNAITHLPGDWFRADGLLLDRRRGRKSITCVRARLPNGTYKTEKPRPLLWLVLPPRAGGNDLVREWRIRMTRIRRAILNSL